MSFTTHTPPPTWWSATRKPLSPEDWQEAVRRAGEQLATMPLTLAAPSSPGEQVTATVSWRVPNFFGGLLRLFGAGSGDDISGQAMAVFRKEGW